MLELRMNKFRTVVSEVSSSMFRTETYEDEEKRKDSVSTIQSVSCRNSFLGNSFYTLEFEALHATFFSYIV